MRTTDLLVEDLDADGDVVMAGVRYENDGHARFRTVLASGPSSGVAGDADRDGDLDLFLGTRSAVPWSGEPDQLWRNDGTAGFTVDATWIATGSAARESVEVETGDLNGDGRIDAAVSGATAGGGSVYLSRSDGRFDVRAIPPNGYPARLAAGDLDGDGDVDLAAATWCSSIPQCGGWADEVLWNDGAGNFTAAALPSDTEAGDVALLDVDLDGHIEVFVAARERGLSAQDALLLNQGGGVFAAAVPGFDHPVDHGEATQLVTADFDADGDDDLLVVNEPRGVAASMMLFPRTRLLLGTGRHLRAPDLARLGKPYELTIHGGASGAAQLFAPRLGHTPVPPIGVLGLDTASLALVTAFGPGPVPRAYRLTVPNVPALAGGAAHWQALVQDAGFRLTNVEYDTVIVH